MTAASPSEGCVQHAPTGGPWADARPGALMVRRLARTAPLTQTDDGSRKEAERAPVLDLLWRKLEDIHRHEVARTVGRQKWTSEETRAAIETLSIGILRRVFSGWSATLLDSDPDKERARMIVELFDLRPVDELIEGGETRHG